jgi:hypothetical protein
MRFVAVGRSLLLAIVAGAVLLTGPLGHARGQQDPDKYAHKIEKKLSHYRQGTLLHLTFKDNTEATGKIHSLDDQSFTFTNSDTNTVETHKYADVDAIAKGSNNVGSTSHHHFL